MTDITYLLVNSIFNFIITKYGECVICKSHYNTEDDLIHSYTIHMNNYKIDFAIIDSQLFIVDGPTFMDDNQFDINSPTSFNDIINDLCCRIDSLIEIDNL